jgi:hypothetical protein
LLLQGSSVPLALRDDLLCKTQFLDFLLEELLEPDGALVLLRILHVVLNSVSIRMIKNSDPQRHIVKGYSSGIIRKDFGIPLRWQPRKLRCLTIQQQRFTRGCNPRSIGIISLFSIQFLKSKITKNFIYCMGKCVSTLFYIICGICILLTIYCMCKCMSTLFNIICEICILKTIFSLQHSILKRVINYVLRI